MQSIRLIFIGFLLFCIIGCKGLVSDDGGGETTTTVVDTSTSTSEGFVDGEAIDPNAIADSVATVEVLEGVFLDGPVEGVTYFGVSESGVTDADGKFLYQDGDDVTFQIGNIRLGSTSGAPILTPIQVARAENENDQKVINMVRFLQTMDDDANHANGIQITSQIRQEAAAFELDFDQNVADFELNTVSEIQALTTFRSAGSQILVPAIEALTLFQSTLEAAGLPTVDLGAGLWVAVGTNGTILSSSDNKTWTSQESGTTLTLNDVKFANDTYIAVGENGVIVTSPDGATWTRQDSGVFTSLFGVTFAQDLFVAVGNSGTILTSPDGVTWTPRGATVFSFRAVEFGNEIYVTSGLGGKILWSRDGFDWDLTFSQQSDNLRGLAFGEGLFVTVGEVGSTLTSEKAQAWSKRTSGTGNILTGGAHGRGTFVSVGYSGTVATSPGGELWTLRSTGTSANLEAIVFGGSVFVTVGDQGTILSSFDGSTWTAETSGVTSDLKGITSGIPF